jgi:hypothetical protein
MEIVGHSQISITANTYTHVLAALQQDAMAKMDSVFGAQPTVVGTVVPPVPPSTTPTDETPATGPDQDRSTDIWSPRRESNP